MRTSVLWVVSDDGELNMAAVDPAVLGIEVPHDVLCCARSMWRHRDWYVLVTTRDVREYPGRFELLAGSVTLEEAGLVEAALAVMVP